ncbi:MAG: hypothetical protein IJJ63_03900 [Bacilli bacterium]|nr:hypothetical protein [Bacilli bacterium]
MNHQVKPIINTTYTLKVETKKIAEQQAKTNEIKLKDIEIEINNPISVDIKDYLENSDKISDSTLKALKLDTSLVNINQAGTYQYKISYKKKTYVGSIKVKEKELPNVSFTLKRIEITTFKEGESLSANPRSYIEEYITDEVYNNITLDISQVKPTIQGDYPYYIIYKGVTYQGKVIVRNPGPTVYTPNNNNSEEESSDNSSLENPQTPEETNIPTT